MNTQNTKPQLLVELFEKAVAAAQPGAALVAALPPPAKGRNLVLGIGKAALSMGLALESTWPADAPLEGLLVGPAGLDSRGLRRLRYLEGAHPVPDAGSEAAALALLTATHGLSPEDQVIALISGGASAQACAPVAGLSLADKQALTQALLASGAGIHEMNTVRKHLSRLKGGRLAAACAPASLHSFIVSDVPGDQLDVIGSGPTLADPSSCAQALEVLERYRIALPPGLRERLASGELETPKPGDPSFAGQQATLIASPQQALLAAAELARQRGWSCHLLSDALEGEARADGAAICSATRWKARPA